MIELGKLVLCPVVTFVHYNLYENLLTYLEVAKDELYNNLVLKAAWLQDSYADLTIKLH